MPAFVALLRGINVGRAKRVAMPDLRALLAALGYGDVRTLLNSGNAVFTGAAQAPAVHARRIRSALIGELGVDVPVIVKSAADIERIVAGNALASVGRDPSRLLVALTQDGASLAAIGALAETPSGADELVVGTDAAYVWCADGLLESRIAVALLAGLRGSVTTRNWATVQKLHALLQAPA